MKKGIASQVFIYIFVMIVIAMILLFGFRQVANLRNLSEKSVYVSFKTDFSKAVSDAYYLNKGSVLVFDKSSRNKPLNVPKEARRVCFDGGVVNFNSEIYEEFIVDHLQGNGCINILNGKLSFRLENIYDGEVKVKISSVGT